MRLYPLVLEKTRALLVREKQERAALRAARSWLVRHASAFADIDGS